MTQKENQPLFKNSFRTVASLVLVVVMMLVLLLYAFYQRAQSDSLHRELEHTAMQAKQAEYEKLAQQKMYKDSIADLRRRIEDCERGEH